eukprot:jgi/Mesen1/2807/ME000172S01950
MASIQCMNLLTHGCSLATTCGSNRELPPAQRSIILSNGSALRARSLRFSSLSRKKSCQGQLSENELRSRRQGICAQSESEAGQKAETKKDSEGDLSSSGGGADAGSLGKDLSKAVKKTANTFAPRASTKTKNPAVPGSTLYSVFEWQAYLSMAAGGLLSFNLVFPSQEPDIWRLMGMWSVWMFTIPSLRARDCSPKEKEALNYLFLLVPLINVTLPLVWKSFAAVWSLDVVAFAAMYTWKLNLLGGAEAVEDQDAS